MSASQRSTQYGILEFDLSVDRASEPDYELIQLPRARQISIIDVPDECYLRFGNKTSPGVDLRDTQKFSREQGFEQAYLENPTGATGTLRLLVGVDLEADPQDTTSIDTISDTVGIENTSSTQIDPATESTLANVRKQPTYAVEYTDVDQNATATTQLYAPANDAEVTGVHLDNPGTSAELRLEVTDGTNTAVLADPAAGDPIDFNDELRLAGGTDSLQVVVEAAEGSAQTATASVSRGEL